jgi:hypothetical protein
VKLVAAEPEHIPFIAEHMREADRIEVGAWGRTPAAALTNALRSSVWALTALFDDEPHAMLGVAPVNMLEGLGVPWMLGTERIYESGREMVRAVPPVVAEMRKLFPRLENAVWAGNDKAKTFIRHFGWEISERQTIVNGVAFQRFA